MGGAGGMQFDIFLMTLTQLNMTPEFTLDKEAKQKLQALREEYRAAQTKYFTDHRLDMEKLQKEMMEAYKSRDVDDIKMAQKKMQEFQAAGVKAEDYVAKAKATLTPEQLKFVEERQAKAEQDRAAAMTRVKEMQERQNGAGGNPRAPEGKAPGNGGL